MLERRWSNRFIGRDYLHCGNTRVFFSVYSPKEQFLGINISRMMNVLGVFDFTLIVENVQYMYISFYQRAK